MSKTYTTDVKTNFCSCLSWKYQRKPVYSRMCKHLLKAGAVVTELHEEWKKKGPIPKIMLYRKNIDFIQENWYCSEKLDGVRGFFDGHTMYSRGGIIIDIPDRIRDYLTLQKLTVDGEFWMQRNSLKKIVNATQSNKNSVYWKGVKFYVFDIHSNKTFQERYKIIQKFPFFCKQKPITLKNIPIKLKDVVENGGEGLVIRNPVGLYKNYGRSMDVIKVKPHTVGSGIYLGKNEFKELSTGQIFKIRGKFMILKPDDKISFVYTGRTSRGKPQYPRLNESI